MRILKVEPGKAPYVKDMKEGLEAIQQEVQGLFQPVYVEDGVILCCNEEGKLNGMKPNRWLEDDIICGPFHHFDKISATSSRCCINLGKRQDILHAASSSKFQKKFVQRLL